MSKRQSCFEVNGKVYETFNFRSFLPCKVRLVGIVQGTPHGEDSWR